MSELCSKFQIPAFNTVDGAAETETVLHCVMVKICYVIQGDIILQKLPGSKFYLPYAHVQCISELYCKFQIPASNTVGGVADTQTVLSVIWSKRVCHSRGHNSTIKT